MDVNGCHPFYTTPMDYDCDGHIRTCSQTHNWWRIQICINGWMKRKLIKTSILQSRASWVCFWVHPPPNSRSPPGLCVTFLVADPEKKTVLNLHFPGCHWVANRSKVCLSFWNITTLLQYTNPPSINVVCRWNKRWHGQFSLICWLEIV